jgi:hypothetical protein
LTIDSHGGLTAGTVVRRNPSVAGRDFRENEGAVLLHTETGAYHRLNPTGARIWRMLDGPTRFDELERRLRGDLPEAAAMATADLAAYLGDLAGRDLVHLEPPPTP